MLSEAEQLQLDLGPFLILTFFNAFLYGILCLQCYLFLQTSFNHVRGTLVNYSIFSLWLLNSLHFACAFYSCYSLLVINISNFSPDSPWSDATLFLASTLSIFVVQSWFIWRAWMLSNQNRPVIAILICMVAAAACVGIALAAIVYWVSGTFEGVARFNWLIYLWNGLDTTANLLLTLTLCVLFMRFRVTPVRSTRSMINVLLVFSLNTGILCFIITVFCLLIRIFLPTNIFFIAVYIPYSQLYSNALLASLNARDWFRSTNVGVTSIPLRTLTSANSTSGILPKFSISNRMERLDGSVVAESGVHVQTDVTKIIL